MLQTKQTVTIVTLHTGEFAEIRKRYYDGFKYIYVMEFSETYERLITEARLEAALKAGLIRMSF